MNEYQMPDGNYYEFSSDAEAEKAIKAWETQFPKPKAPSGFVKGLTDPFAGTAQLIGKGLSAIGVPYGDTLADYYTNLEKEYTAQRQSSGEEGIDWGRIAGNVLNPASVVPLAKIGQATRLAAPAQAAIVGGLAAATTPVGTDNFAREKTEQVALGAALGPAGEMVARGVGRALSPNVSSAERTIRAMGVTPTPGQSIGGQAKAIEEFAENLPLVGGGVREAKKGVTVKFNQGVINNSLKKVGEKLPDDLVGNEAVDFAFKLKDNKYTEALDGTILNLGLKDKARVKGLVANSKLYDQVEFNKANKILDLVVFNKLPQGTTQIDGDMFKSIDSELKSEIFSLKNSADLSDRRVGRALEGSQKYIRELFGKQNPEKSSLLRRVDALDRDLRVISTASANSGAEKGVFTPKQYQTAVRQSDQTRGKRVFARGKANGQDVAQAGLEVLGEEADAILQGRLAAQVAGGITISTNPLVGGAIGAAIKAGYSPAGLRVIDALVAKRPQFAIVLGDLIKSNSAGLGGISAQEIIEAYNNSENLPAQ